VRFGVDTGISFSTGYGEWEAAIAAGATLEELEKWDRGLYPVGFKAKVVAWYGLHSLIELHSNDAVARKQAQDAKHPQR